MMKFILLTSVLLQTHLAFATSPPPTLVLENQFGEQSKNSVLGGTFGGVLSIGVFGSVPNASGMSYNLGTGVLNLQPADATRPGGVSTLSQTFAGAKTFLGAISASNLSGSNSGDVTLGTANGLGLSAQILSLGLASGSTNGALSAADWNTFNGKQSPISVGALDSQAENADGLSFVGNALALQSADDTHPGVINNTAQSIGGAKTFLSPLTVGDGTDPSILGTPDLFLNFASGSSRFMSIKTPNTEGFLFMEDDGSGASTNNFTIGTGGNQAIVFQPNNGYNPVWIEPNGLVSIGRRNAGVAPQFQSDPAAVKLSVNAANSQTANLLEVRTEGLVLADYIDKDGNLNIGSGSAPVVIADAPSLFVSANDSADHQINLKNNSLEGFFILDDASGAVELGTGTVTPLEFQVSDQYAPMRITSAGGVVIGKPNPAVLGNDGTQPELIVQANASQSVPVFKVTDSGSSAYFQVSSDGSSTFNTHLVHGVSTPVSANDAVNKSYVDTIAATKPLNTYRVDKAGIDSGTCGTYLNPCLTISQALTNIGPSLSAADVKKAKTVLIGAGAYDESLTIPSGRIISLIAEGVVVLGDGAGANWASTTPRSVNWNPVAADLFGSDIKPSLSIGTIAPADATSTFIAESQNFTISGNLVMNGDGTTKTLNLNGVKIWGNLSHTDASLVNFQSYRSLVVGSVSTTGNLVLERAYDSRFNGLLSVNAINMAMNSNFLGGITVQSIQQNLLPNGIFHSNIAGTFTGPAASFRVDNATQQYFRTAGGSLAGGATPVILDDSYLSQSLVGSQPTCSSAKRGLQYLVQGGAGVADIYQVCQKDAADAYGWVTH